MKIVKLKKSLKLHQHFHDKTKETLHTVNTINQSEDRRLQTTCITTTASQAGERSLLLLAMSHRNSKKRNGPTIAL